MDSEQLDQAIRGLNAKAIMQLQKIKSPSSNLKNIVLAFLTVFHEELDGLIDESMAAEAE